MGRPVEDLLRELTPQVVGTLARRHGQFDACEDATQEAVLAALSQWPETGIPDQPRAWLLTVARRHLIDQWRSDSARRHREERAADGPLGAFVIPGADEQPADADDTLILMLMCCHPALDPPAQVALTLRAVGGLTTKEIAAAFLVPEATMAKRITRAKRTIAVTEKSFELPTAEDFGPRLRAVLGVLYLIFNEGYTASAGARLLRAELSNEALRLTRVLLRLVPAEGEVAGLLALMLLTDARRPARTGAAGSLIALEEQDRSLWDADAIEEGLELLSATLGRHPVGQYQLQAAIAAVHDEARTAEATDWAQILALYETLEYVAPGPMVTLSRAVALANVRGPRAGLALLGTLDESSPAIRSYRFDAVRAHLLELAGDKEQARIHYVRAARSTASIPEQRYLELRASRLGRRDARCHEGVGQERTK